MTKIGEILLLTALAFAQPMISVQSSVDKSRIGVGDDFVFTVSVISNSAVDITPPRPPHLDGFELLESWDATAISQKLMPGPRGMDFQTQRRREFNYRLRAVRAGRQSIGAFDVSIDGKNHPSQPLVIDVQATPQGESGGGRGRPQREDDDGFPPGFPNMEEIDRAEEEMFNQLLQRRGQGFQGGMQRPPPAHRTLPVNPNEAFFVQVEVDKTEVYEGEMIVASWYIYTRGQMETLDRVKFPDLRGFWKEIIEEVPTIQFTEEIVNGIPYRKALLASHALFPIKAGTAVIDEYKIKSRVRLPAQGFGGYFGKPYEYTKSSKRVNIKVKPLPTEGRPASFTGAVGTFDVNAAVDSSSVPAGQPFTLRIRFEGQGNAKAIELPAIDWPKTVEVYDTKSESRFFKNGSSYKQFDVLLIPRQEGELEIPSFEMAMFNPATGKYETRRTQPVKLTVVANPNAGSGGAQRLAETGLAAPAMPPAKAAKGDVLPEPVVAFSGASMTERIFQRMDVWAGLYAAVLLVLGFKARTEFGGNRRRRDLREILQKRYKALDKVVKTGDTRRIGAEMANLFSLVLGDIAGETGASEEVGKMLERIPPSLRRDFAAEILKKHEVFQVLAFAPTEALGELKDPARVRREVGEARALLDKLVRKSMEDENATV